MLRKIWLKRMERLIIMFAALGFATQRFLPQQIGLVFYILGSISFILWVYFYFHKSPPK